jgi:hypothetical protein
VSPPPLKKTGPRGSGPVFAMGGGAAMRYVAKGSIRGGLKRS